MSIEYSDFFNTNPHGCFFSLMYDPKLNAENIDEVTKKGKKVFLDSVVRKFTEKTNKNGIFIDEKKIIKQYKPKGRKAFCKLFIEALSNNFRLSPVQVITSNYAQSFIREIKTVKEDVLKIAAPKVIKRLLRSVYNLNEMVAGQSLNHYEEFAAKLIMAYLPDEELDLLSTNFTLQDHLRCSNCKKIIKTFTGKNNLGKEFFDLFVELLKCSLTLPLESCQPSRRCINYQENLTPKQLDVLEDLIKGHVDLFKSFGNRRKEQGNNYIARLDSEYRFVLGFQ